MTGPGGVHARFARDLLIWLLTPLLIELAVASARTNLLRIRYWIGLLPPLAALAGLGLTVITATLLRHVRARLTQPGTAPSRLGWLKPRWSPS